MSNSIEGTHFLSNTQKVTKASYMGGSMGPEDGKSFLNSTQNNTTSYNSQ